jgi:hypothetical protein
MLWITAALGTDHRTGDVVWSSWSFFVGWWYSNGVLAGYFGPIGDPGELAQQLCAIPAVVQHGLFPPAMVSDILIGRGVQVHCRSRGD